MVSSSIVVALLVTMLSMTALYYTSTMMFFVHHKNEENQRRLNALSNGFVYVLYQANQPDTQVSDIELNPAPLISLCKSYTDEIITGGIESSINISSSDGIGVSITVDSIPTACISSSCNTVQCNPVDCTLPSPSEMKCTNSPCISTTCETITCDPPSCTFNEDFVPSVVVTANIPGCNATALDISNPHAGTFSCQSVGCTPPPIPSSCTTNDACITTTCSQVECQGLPLSCSAVDCGSNFCLAVPCTLNGTALETSPLTSIADDYNFQDICSEWPNCYPDAAITGIAGPGTEMCCYSTSVPFGTTVRSGVMNPGVTLHPPTSEDDEITTKSYYVACDLEESYCSTFISQYFESLSSMLINQGVRLYFRPLIIGDFFQSSYTLQRNMITPTQSFSMEFARAVHCAFEVNMLPQLISNLTSVLSSYSPPLLSYGNLVFYPLEQSNQRFSDCWSSASYSFQIMSDTLDAITRNNVISTPYYTPEVDLNAWMLVADGYIFCNASQYFSSTAATGAMLNGIIQLANSGGDGSSVTGTPITQGNRC